MRRGTTAVRAAVAVLATAALTGFGLTPTTAVAEPGAECPALYALGVQGTGQSSPDASPTDDTGFLSTVFTPLLGKAETAGVAVAREYIPYESGFGGFVTGGAVPYEQSVAGGVTKLIERLTDIAARCPDTLFGLAGYSQGAHVVSTTAQKIGTGGGPVPADRVAAVALFGDPTRASGTGTFPGAPKEQTAPAAAPGTDGQAMAALEQLRPSAAGGGGVGPRRDQAVDFGMLTSRVASFCSPGDLSCDAPENAVLLKAVANVAGQADHGGDPIRALASITEALAMTTLKTATTVINEDISGNSLATLSLNPEKSISQRIAEASDPRTPFDPASALQALFKVGTIALNSTITVVKTLLNPQNIAEIATAGLANPIAGLAVFGTKLLNAVPEIIPPATATRWVQQAFQIVEENITDNADLLNAATWVKYSDAITRHGSYQSDPVTVGGAPATSWVADWLVAAARDRVASGPIAGPTDSTPTATPTTAPSSTPYFDLDINPTTTPSQP